MGLLHLPPSARQTQSRDTAQRKVLYVAFSGGGGGGGGGSSPNRDVALTLFAEHSPTESHG